MERKRVHEIMDSLGVIDVHYRNQPVWLEQISGEQVQIRFLPDGPKKVVDIHELYE